MFEERSRQLFLLVKSCAVLAESDEDYGSILICIVDLSSERNSLGPAWFASFPSTIILNIYKSGWTLGRKQRHSPRQECEEEQPERGCPKT